MRLLYFVQYFRPEISSGSTLVDNLLDGFVEHGWSVDVYTPTPTRGVTEEQRKEFSKKRIEVLHDGKLTIHRMPLYREGKGFISRAIRYILFSMQCLLVGLKEPAEAVFTGSGPPTQGVVAGIIGKLTGKKIIYNLQDVFPDSLISANMAAEGSLLVKIGRKLEMFTYRNADVIITISSDMKGNITAKGAEIEKIKVVPNWVDTDVIMPLERDQNRLFDELCLDRSGFYVIYAGNVGSAQGVDVIVRAAKELQACSQIQFLIFGNGSEEENIRKMIDAEGLDNIHMYPLYPQERVPEVYGLADAVIISCKAGVGKSGFPSKTWTIMACGVPIIGSFDLDSEFARTIESAQCGTCVEAGNEKPLANMLMDFYENREHIRIMGINARNYAQKHASKVNAVKEYIDIIEVAVCEDEV